MIRRRTSRRSQKRLGAQYASTAQPIRFSLAPAAGRWGALVSRLISALLLALLGWATYIIFASPNFYVYGIQVQGNTTVTNDEVYAASDLEGLSVFWVNPATVAERVQTLPNVKAAHVTVRLPAQVTITVEERAPELVWQTGETRWWVDAEGAILSPRAVLSDTLTIVDVDAQPLSPGQTLDLSILEAASSLRRLLPELRVMHYSHATGISFRTVEGWPVYMGDAHNMDAKLTILVALRKELLARGITPEFIDVRFVERPFYE